LHLASQRINSGSLENKYHKSLSLTLSSPIKHLLSFIHPYDKKCFLLCSSDEKKASMAICDKMSLKGYQVSLKTCYMEAKGMIVHKVLGIYML